LLALPDIGELAVGMRGDFVDGPRPRQPQARYESVHTVAKGGVIYVDGGQSVGPTD
jgi:hypothetical protein